MECTQPIASPAFRDSIGPIAKDTLGLAVKATDILGRVPGSAVLGRYIRASYQNDPFRSILELFLFLIAVRYFVGSKYNPIKRATHVLLTEDEIDELVDDWVPEPLLQEQSEVLRSNECLPVLHRDAPTGPRTKLRDGRTVTNLAKYNHYNLASDPNLIELASRTIRTYGVGPCSAPGFAGTFDVHLKLEQDIASHFGTESTIIYSQSFSTISSVISTFCKRGDIIVADRAVNYPIRMGIRASRSIVRWFEHNDMEDLERVLAKLVSEERPRTRRFIITEALPESVGDMIDLYRLLELAYKYKFRDILDEMCSYGILGATGRGLTELQNVDPANIDILVGSLAGCVATGGGFCTGREVTFSASLAAFLTTTASAVIARLQSDEGASEELGDSAGTHRQSSSATPEKRLGTVHQCTVQPSHSFDAEGPTCRKPLPLVSGAGVFNARMC